MQAFLQPMEKPDTVLLQSLSASACLPFPMKDAPGEAARTAVLQLNSADPNLIVQARRTATAAALAPLAKTRCIVAPPTAQVPAQGAVAPLIPWDATAQEFARFNVSNDAQYRKQRRGRVAGMAVGAAMMHSPIATNLSQLPLPCAYTREMLEHPHRPIARFQLLPAPCAPFSPADSNRRPPGMCC